MGLCPLHDRVKFIALSFFSGRNITNLVVIGGDGSLTGANCFRNEWPGRLIATRVLVILYAIIPVNIGTCTKAPEEGPVQG
jgi:hypothetical protein